MICPNCKSNIPSDSKFCPDCGTPVVNAEEVLAKAKEIVSNYKRGYEFYVNNGILPRLVDNSTIEKCEKIIAKKQEIVKKHNEILQEEKRIKEAKELEDLRHEVKRIYASYTEGFNSLASSGTIPHFNVNMPSIDCYRILNHKFDIIRVHNEIDEQKRFRDLASGITMQYAKGYNYYVRLGMLPRFVHNADMDVCKAIISKKTEIIQKNIEILRKEEVDLMRIQGQHNSFSGSHSSQTAEDPPWWFYVIVICVIVYFFVKCSQS